MGDAILNWLRGHRALAWLALVGFASFALGGAAELARPWHGFELETVDARFELRGDKRVPMDIVVVEIDDESRRLVRARSPGTPPPDSELGIPRRAHAQVIKRLVADGARAIGYAVEFAGESTEAHEAQDVALLEAIGLAREKLVLAPAFPEARCGEPLKAAILGGEAYITQDQRARIGAPFLDQDDDGGVRRIRPKVRSACGDECERNLELSGYEPFSLVVADASGGETSLPQDGCEWIDFRGDPGSFQRMSFADVYRRAGTYRPQRVRGKTVIVGPDARYETPTGSMTAVELEAHAVSTLKTGARLRAPGTVVNILFLLAAASLPLFVLLRGLPSRRAVLLGALAALVSAPLAVVGGTLLLSVDQVLLVPLTYPLLTLALSVAGVILVRLRLGRREPYEPGDSPLNPRANA
jgi:CHASE2 domain-containing sensor protein